MTFYFPKLTSLFNIDRLTIITLLSDLVVLEVSVNRVIPAAILRLLEL